LNKGSEKREVEVLGLMDLEKLRKEEDVRGVMMLVADLGLTFYDASYLYIAKSRDAIHY